MINDAAQRLKSRAARSSQLLHSLIFTMTYSLVEISRRCCGCKGARFTSTKRHTSPCLCKLGPPPKSSVLRRTSSFKTPPTPILPYYLLHRRHAQEVRPTAFLHPIDDEKSANSMKIAVSSGRSERPSPALRRSSVLFNPSGTTSLRRCRLVSPALSLRALLRMARSIRSLVPSSMVCEKLFRDPATGAPRPSQRTAHHKNWR